VVVPCYDEAARFDPPAFHRSLARDPTLVGKVALSARPFELRWCFDVELLARLLGLEARRELDVARQRRGRSAS